MTKPMWMVRAGEGAWRIDDFESQSIVSVGWRDMGDMSQLKTRDAFLREVAKRYPTNKKAQTVVSASQLFRFLREIKVGDSITTYNPGQRTYLLGSVAGDPEYAPQMSEEQPNLRRVNWTARVQRDLLSVSARNSLGAIATLFLVPADVADEMLRVANAGTTQAVPPAEQPGGAAEVEQVADLYKDTVARADEFIKDRINLLEWDEMQDLVAGLLRAMGYKTLVSPSGSDRGKDIVASPDGLGFEDPRIVVEVKHRNAAMGSTEIRSFLGGRHDRDKGLYVSTGGFTKEARYEAERGRIPVTLMDLDDLVRSVREHYEQMDSETKRLLPLRKLYWPA